MESTVKKDVLTGARLLRAGEQARLAESRIGLALGDMLSPARRARALLRSVSVEDCEDN